VSLQVLKVKPDAFSGGRLSGVTDACLDFVTCGCHLCSLVLQMIVVYNA